MRDAEAPGVAEFDVAPRYYDAPGRAAARRRQDPCPRKGSSTAEAPEDRHDDCDGGDGIRWGAVGSDLCSSGRHDGDIRSGTDVAARRPLVERRHHSNPECNFLANILRMVEILDRLARKPLAKSSSKTNS